ncbi:type II toxin-antitoxin system VapB15 family antitoxin [Belliella aquatica]|uniref:Uncharacterized protein n=1 Tax=Belliella aquatica TaxID=1323734 RepID=A0ABQ1MUP9_9BACT|nr:hypothetical protein [Belliella aquatica]MCH7406015.1 hypothetical protein [Belliella aquatica]GGC43356.1 hypothetical protein GCM10010993_22370 [Belliella aquatica]
MKTALKIDLTFEQVISIVKQLSTKQKLELSKELEKEAINSKLSLLLKTFKSDEIDLNVVNEEVESVRQEIYDNKKR